MVFNSMEALKNHILSCSKVAVEKAQEQVYQIINNFLKQYYSEFDPSVYERTEQLLHSLVKADIQPSGNGWTASVYFDITTLNYSMKTINGIQVPNKGWSEEKTLTAAAHGSHGGYIEGIAVFDDPLEVLNTEAYNILKNMLIESGVPVK